MHANHLATAARYLDFLIKHGDTSKEINTILVRNSLELAHSRNATAAEVDGFKSLIISCKYYDCNEILALIDKLKFPIQTVHLYSKLGMHKLGLEILVQFGVDKSEQYCKIEYNQYDRTANYLYDTLYELLVSQKKLSQKELLTYLNRNAYFMTLAPYDDLDSTQTLSRMSIFLIQRIRHYQYQSNSIKIRNSFLTILALAVS